MKSLAVLVLLAILGGAFAEGIGNETITNDAATNANRIWRNFSVTTPLLAPGTVIFRGVRIQRTGFTFKRDVALFGATINRQTSFGFSYYDAEADISSGTPLRDNGSFSFSSARVAGAVRLLGLVEYLEVNGVPGYQPEGDTQLSNVTLTPTLASGQDIYLPPVRNDTACPNTTDTDCRVHWLDVQTINGVFRCRIYASAKPIFIDNRPLTPDRIKMTFEIDYWNPSNTAASTNPNAKLALVGVYAALGIQSYRNRTVTIDNSDDGVDSEGDGVVSGGYNWELNTRVRNSSGSGNARDGHITTQFLRDITGTGPFGRFGTVVQGAFDATWKVSLLVHDLNVTNGEKLLWDPNADVTVNYANVAPSTVPSSAAQVPVAFALALLLALVALLF